MVKPVDKIRELKKVVADIDDVCKYGLVTRSLSGELGFTCNKRPNLTRISISDNYCTEEDWKYCPFNPVSKKLE